MAITLRGNADSDFSNGIDINTDEIELNDDGTANFTGNVSSTSGSVFSGGTNGNGAVAIRQDTAGTRAFWVSNTTLTPGANNVTASITGDGAATFAGRLRAGSTALNNLTHFITSTVNSTNGALLVQNGNTADAIPAAQFRVGSSTPGTTNVLVNFSLDNGSTGAGSIVGNGPSVCTFGTFSDSRLKTNITELPSQWDNIKALKPSQFKYSANLEAGTQTGFIAQEFKEIYPEAVGLTPVPVPVEQRADPEVEETVDRYMLAGWGKTEAYLVKALQEAMARIETLESRLSTLEGGTTE